MLPLSEPWFPLSSQESAHAEAAQLDLLIAAVAREVEQGASRVWLSVGPGRAAESDSLRLAVSVALCCPDVQIVAAGVRAPSWIRLAEDAATADGLCGGRLELGFRDLPDEEALERLREAWSGAPVSLGAEDRIELHPRPVRRDGPALWVEVADAADAARAAELGLGAIAPDVGLARAHSAAAGGHSLPVALVAWAGAAADEAVAANVIVLSRKELGALGESPG